MDPTIKNRSLLRSRASKKRGNPIFISSRLITESVNEVITSEQSYISDSSTALVNKEQSDIPEYNFSDSIASRSLFKRQRTNDNTLLDECSRNDPFVVFMPLIANKKRLDFCSRRKDNKRCPYAMATAAGKTSRDPFPKPHLSLNATSDALNIDILLRTPLSSDEGLTTDSIASLGWILQIDEAAGARQLQVEEESSEIIKNDNDKGCTRDPQRDVEEIRECTTKVRNNSFLNNGTAIPVFEMSRVINQEVSIENFGGLCSTIEHDKEAPSDGLSYVDSDLFANNTTSSIQGDEDCVSNEQPILKKRKKPNILRDIHEKIGDRRGISFKDRLNPIAAAEYDEMEIVELDIYDEAPNQFRSDVPKEFIRRWSTQDTEEFYKCIVFLGLDFGRIATVMKRTQKQITNKYKIEQKNNDKRLHNALILQGEFFEYRKKYKDLMVN